VWLLLSPLPWTPSTAAVPLPSAAQQPSLWLLLSAEGGISFPWEGEQFLHFYRLLTDAEGIPSAFLPRTMLAIGLRIPLSPAWQLRLNVGRHQLEMDHTYRQRYSEPHRQGERVIRAVLSLHSFPIWFGMEWHPFQTAFHTYLHGAIGLVPSKLYWAETVYSSVPADTRLGGVYDNRWSLRPGIRLLVGTTLRFDAAVRSSLLESLRIEAAYSFIPLRRDLLHPLLPQLSNAPPDLPTTFILSGSALSLSCAVVLQLPFFFPSSPHWHAVQKHG